MIAFGSSITDTEAYARYAGRGIAAAAETGSAVYAFAAVGPISRTYNLMLERASAEDDLEALVLVHPHAEIVDPGFCEQVRRAFSRPEVAVAGCSGAAGVSSIAWWEGMVSSASTNLRYGDHGGGELEAFGWAHPIPPPAEVDVVDGFLLVLSPWAVRNVRFDESLALGHGYDFDYCMQVRAAGHKVVTADLRVTRHQGLELFSDPELWVEKYIQVAEKWDGRIPGAQPEEVDWEARARRADAEREAARAITYTNALRSDARLLELENALEKATGSLSWQVTAPLRAGNRLRKMVRRRGS